MERKQFDISDFYKAVACRGKECISGSEQLDKCEKPLTMVFINMQPLENVYSQDEAYKNGTLFPNLNKPFLGGSRR